MNRLGLLGCLCVVLLFVSRTALAGPGDDLKRAIDLYKAHEYTQARDLLQTIHPFSLTAEQQAIYTDYLARTQQAAAQRSAPQHSSSAAVPVNGLDTPPIVSYPSDWARIVRRQQCYGALQRAEDQPTRLTRQKFAAVVPEISLPPGTTFRDAIDRIADASGLNLYVNWPAVEMAGYTQDMEVTLPPLRGITWRTVINLVLRQLSAQLGGAAPLDWAIDAGVLTISTRSDLNTQLVLRVYDIGDLLLPPLVVQPSGGWQISGGTGSSGAAGGTAGTGVAGSAATGGTTGGLGGGGTIP